MHTPGHNPFQTITEQPYGLTEYEYQGISPEIIQALQGVFDFGDLAGFSGVAGGEPVGINVLEDQSLREGIKAFSDWPTIPQLYIKKEFVGGCDIVKEMYENGELKKILDDKEINYKK